MIRIGICEDEKAQAEQICELVSRSLFAKTEYEIIRYASGEEVVQDVVNGSFTAELLLLDIHMKQMSGLETAAFLRRQRVDVDIIFITVSEKDVYEGYTYKAFAYILKSMLKVRLKKELLRYLEELDENPECMQVYVNGTIRKLKMGNVWYFESRARKITAFLEHETLEFYNKIDDLEQMLRPWGFLRCHQSYLVNESHVTVWNREYLMVQDKRIPVSRKGYERLREMNKFAPQDRR